MTKHFFRLTRGKTLMRTMRSGVRSNDDSQKTIKSRGREMKRAQDESADESSIIPENLNVKTARTVRHQLLRFKLKSNFCAKVK